MEPVGECYFCNTITFAARLEDVDFQRSRTPRYSARIQTVSICQSCKKQLEETGSLDLLE